jgi:hypothetical protein
MSLATFVMLAVPFVMLPIWAAETVAIRRPDRRRLGWRLAIASIVTALGLAGALWALPLVAPFTQLMVGGGMVLLACDVAGVVWGYAARPSARRGFPVGLTGRPPQPPSALGPIDGGPRRQEQR